MCTLSFMSHVFRDAVCVTSGNVCSLCYVIDVMSCPLMSTVTSITVSVLFFQSFYLGGPCSSACNTSFGQTSFSV